MSLVQEALRSKVKVQDSSGSVVDPATEGTLIDVRDRVPEGLSKDAEDGGLNVHLSGTDVGPPACLTGDIDQHDVTVGAAVRLDPVPLASRKTVSLKAHAENADDVYIGFSSSITTTSKSRQMNPGEPIDIEVGPDVQLWAIAATSGQRISITQVAGP